MIPVLHAVLSLVDVSGAQGRIDLGERGHIHVPEGAFTEAQQLHVEDLAESVLDGAQGLPTWPTWQRAVFSPVIALRPTAAAALLQPLRVTLAATLPEGAEPSAACLAFLLTLDSTRRVWRCASSVTPAGSVDGRALFSGQLRVLAPFAIVLANTPAAQLAAATLGEPTARAARRLQSIEKQRALPVVALQPSGLAAAASITPHTSAIGGFAASVTILVLVLVAGVGFVVLSNTASPVACHEGEPRIHPWNPSKMHGNPDGKLAGVPKMRTSTRRRGGDV
jgi:hypothetical protein